MADEQLSKRERQKQRREDKRRREEQQRAAARRRRLLAYAAVVVVLLGGVGVAVGRQITDRRAQEVRAEEVAQRLDEIGCGEVEQLADQGRGHLAAGAQLAEADPAVLYDDRPATSGTHMGAVALTGVYDKEVDERLLLHNLEHGYVAFWHDETADEQQVADLQSWAQERIDGDEPKVIVARYHEDLPADGSFAAVAWGHRQVCDEFDPDVFQLFLDEYHDRGDVPEPFIPAHTDPEASGVLDPNATEGAFLFPPLGEAQAGSEEVEDHDAPEEEEDGGADS